MAKNNFLPIGGGGGVMAQFPPKYATAKLYSYINQLLPMQKNANKFLFVFSNAEQQRWSSEMDQYHWVKTSKDHVKLATGHCVSDTRKLPFLISGTHKCLIIK